MGQTEAMSARSWASLTTEQLAESVGEQTVAVQVLGAIEQHGPHLPLDTDTRIAEGLLDRALHVLDDAVDVLVLPPLTIGASDEHKSFPGTLGLDGRGMIDALIAIGADVARSGVGRLVWINGHGGNRAAMDLAALTLRREHALRVVKCTYTRLGSPPVDWPAEELARGFHGGALETALMRHLVPDAVREDRVAEFPMRPDPDAHRLLSAEGAASWAWLAEDLNRSGVIGDARLGSAEIGATLVNFYARRIARVLGEAATLPPIE